MWLLQNLYIKAITSVMSKSQTHTLFIICGTLFFLLLIIFAAFKIYQFALDETKRNHQLLQKDMADATAAGIKYYLENLANDLQLLAAFRRIQKFERDLLHEPLLDLYGYAKNYGVKTIFVANLETEIIYSAANTIPTGVRPLLRQQIPWASDTSNWGTAWYSAVLPEVTNGGQSDFYFLILVPLVKHSNHPKIEPELVGFIGEVVSFNWLIQKYLNPINLSSSVAAWIMDNRGRLLFHPEHPEMVLRDILKVSPDCQSCHLSFEVQNQMIASEAAYGELTVGEEPTKIISHVPIQFMDERWILVISSNLSDVIFILQNRFKLFFFIILIIVATIIVVGYLLYFFNAKRIRAEEERHLTEQKDLLHQQICHASKLASIGELIDTVAHEINTPISIILAQTHALQLKFPDNANAYSEELQIIKDQIQRISNYTRRLLNYSQLLPFQPKPYDLALLMDECIYLLGHRFRANHITLKKNFPAHLPKISVDGSQIEQVFINLLNNAIDAIGKKGEIEIDMVHQQGKPISGIETKIADNGEGISDESLFKIFEPFFTTKKPSKGTGLGLSISKAIIQRHNGKISVTSQLGIGTTFAIFLPINQGNYVCAKQS